MSKESKMAVRFEEQVTNAVYRNKKGKRGGEFGINGQGKVGLNLFQQRCSVEMS